MISRYSPTLFALVVVAAVAAAAPAPKSYEVIVESNVEMKTRDGVTLRADIYRPKADGKFPVLLNRTPYDKYIYIGDAMASAARGYVFIVQDSRGRFTSDGEWYPFKYEAQDTYDTVEWAAGLPYSNGKVGMVGISYVGVPELLGATAAPPHLVAIFPGITASDYHENWVYQGGALSQGFSQGWSSFFVAEEMRRREAKAIPPDFWSTPHSPADYPVLDPVPAKKLAAYYFDWIAHPTFDDYWKQWSIERHYDRIKVPALHVGAWYDYFMPGALRNYAGIKTRGGSEAARRGQRLLMLPGGHAGFGQKIGDVDFGKGSVFTYEDLRDYGLRWFDWVLKGIDNGMEKEKPVRLFIMGRNVWRDEDDWPLARAVSTRYYLHSSGAANSLTGDGVLDRAAAAGSEPPDTYVYDPSKPTPTWGGVMGGPRDQRAVEGRPDILVYTTAAFAKDTEVTGMITLELCVSSSAVDTDFTGKLIDVWPDGFAQDLTEGILRARYRNSMERPELMNPGQVYRLTIELGATADVFLAGHRLRLAIASASYPRFDRNPNTGAEPETATTFRQATNVIYHDRDHPSALVVPIIP